MIWETQLLFFWFPPWLFVVMIFGPLRIDHWNYKVCRCDCPILNWMFQVANLRCKRCCMWAFNAVATTFLRNPFTRSFKREVISPLILKGKSDIFQNFTFSRQIKAVNSKIVQNCCVFTTFIQSVNCRNFFSWNQSCQQPNSAKLLCFHDFFSISLFPQLFFVKLKLSKGVLYRLAFRWLYRTIDTCLLWPKE